MIKKAVLTLTILLVSTTALAVSNSPAKTVKTEQTVNFIVTPSIAYRYDVFKWSIPHSKFTNKKLSELIWKNNIIQPSIKIETEPQSNQFTFLGQVKYGYILKNPSESWDYDWIHEPNKSQLYSKTLSSVKGNILDLSGAIGYSVNLFKDNLLTFYIGYDYSDYRNKNYGATQLTYTEMIVPSNQLVSKYYFKTQAPWLGLSLKAPLNDKFSITPTVKYYSFKYIGKGYWIRRYDLKQNPSFKDTAKGRGIGFDVDLLYKYSNNLEFKINLETKKFKMNTGRQQTFTNTKSFNGEGIFSDKLLDFKFISSSISAGFNYKL